MGRIAILEMYFTFHLFSNLDSWYFPEYVPSLYGLTGEKICSLALFPVVTCTGGKFLWSEAWDSLVEKDILAMDIKIKEEFEFFMQRALASYSAGSNTDDNYIELYNMLLRYGYILWNFWLLPKNIISDLLQ